MAEPILVTLERKMWPLFKDIFETREGNRKKTSVFFSGLKEKTDSKHRADIDSMFSGTFNESYHKIVDGMPNMKNTTEDQISIDNINTQYISSQPINDKSTKENTNKNYESGVVKKNSMKNNFEENLFKIEDERFEIDIYIERFKAVMRWLSQAIEPSTTDERAKFLIDKVKKFQIIDLIYGNKTDELLGGMENHRSNVIPIVLKRIQEKLDVLKDSKARFETENWTQGLETNFHRSLDQKSFSIKFYDRKVVISKSISS